MPESLPCPVCWFPFDKKDRLPTVGIEPGTFGMEAALVRPWECAAIPTAENV